MAAKDPHKNRDAYIKMRDLVNLFRPLIEAEEILKTVAAAESLVKEMTSQREDLGKEVAALAEEKKRLQDAVKWMQEEEARVRKERLRKVEEAVALAEASAKKKIQERQESLEAVLRCVEEKKAASSAESSILDAEINNRKDELALITDELAKLKKKFG